ncbi:hypothetical protein NLG97_g3144 [Lecanicillium saksenae]|uniref:Uncharacterized protein n=1 Tax=Lecanicillium saksenae TaxID=468837 RepID=A0ACC1QYW8_9HYPO|nr:hypothetical protein NLG97_g3144 [Lecanicillium saksenae]
MEQATKKHFYHHGQTPAGAEENCHWCQIRSLPNQSTIPITIVNDVDSELLPEDFRFINAMVLGQGVEPAEDSFRSGCSCTDDGDCQYTGCLCLADLEDDDDEMNGHGRKAYAYHTHGTKAGLLRSRLQNSTVPLVVERGRTVPLQIFKTSNRGWGVRSQTPIKQGQFVDRYLGEIITAEEADRRRANSAVSQRKDVYLFALDKFTDPDSLDPRLNGPPLEVDGEFMSGPTRFINHSCNPNLRIFARVGDHADKHIHDLALFAIRDIGRGEELTFDYVDGVVDEQDEVEGVEGMTECLCGNKRNYTKEYVGSRKAAMYMKELGTAKRRAQAMNTRENTAKYGKMSGFRWPRQKRHADAQAEHLKIWFRSSVRWAVLLEDNEFTKNEIFVPIVYKEYVSVATDTILASCNATAGEMRRSVSTFFNSPVVRAAFGDFITQCASPGFKDFLESKLIHVLESLADSFNNMRLDTTSRRVPWQAAKRTRDDKLKQLALEYLVRIETWRLEGLANGKPWTFGTRSSRYQFLASTLVQLWYMEKEGCFCAREIRTSSRDWNILWDNWAEGCTRDVVTDDKLEKDVCVGVGWRPVGWLEKSSAH